MPAPLPSDEGERLDALRQYRILDTPPQQELDDLLHLAAHVCGAPLAAISLVDADRQWFKAVLGLDTRQTSRDAAFCTHTILQDDGLIVPDAQADPRFADNPLVTGYPRIRFYAGAVLRTSHGHALGSLCVMDRVPRHLTPEQQTALRTLARQVSHQMEWERRFQLQEREAAERAAVEAERQRLAAIVEASADAIVSTDLGGKIMTWNAGAERLFGYAAAEIVGQPQAVLVAPGEPRLDSRFLPTLFRQERVENLDMAGQRKDGERLDVSLTLSLIRDASGKAVAISAVGRDVTQKKRAEKTLEAQHRFQTALLESLQEGIVACDAAGILRLFNRATREFHGLPEQPLPPERWAEHFDLYGADGVTLLPTHEIPLFRALQGDTVRGAEMVIAPRHGPVRTLLASGQAIFDAQGHKLGAVVAMHDITERKQGEDALQRSEARLKDAQKTAHIGSWEFDAATGHIHWSEELFGLFGLDSRDGEPSVDDLMTCYHPDDVPMHRKITARALADGLPYEFDIRILRRDGEVRWAHAAGRGERDAAGAVVRLTGTLLDIHERKSMEEALRESKQFIEGVAGASTGHIFVLDIDTMSHVYSNRDVADLLGYSPQERQGMGDDPLSAILHPDDLHRVRSRFAQFARKAEGEVVEIEYRVQHASGEWRWMWNRETVFKRHADGTPRQILGTAHDVTERKQAQEEAARLAAIVESSQDAIIGTTLDGTLVSWNGAAQHLYGYAEAEIIGQHASCLAPAGERGFVGEIIRAVLRGERRENRHVRRQRKDGAWIDVSLTFSPIKNALGETTGVAAIGRDITEQKKAEAALRRSEEALRTVTEGAPIVLYATDAAGIVTFSEGAGLERLGLAPGEAVGKTVFEMYPGRPDITRHFRRALAGETVSYDVDVNDVSYHNEVRPQRDAAGDITGLIGVGHDVTDRKQAEGALREIALVLELQKRQLEDANAELATLATLDGLTGLANRRAFDGRLQEAFERASRYAQPLSLLLLDVDHFKDYNDTWGHLAGDEALREIGRVLRTEARGTDIVARYGGEEIAVILPETDEEGAVQVAERVRLAVAAGLGGHRSVTVSLGICTLDPGMERAEDMVAYADRALYQSKTLGRNCWTHARHLQKLSLW